MLCVSRRKSTNDQIRPVLETNLMVCINLHILFQQAYRLGLKEAERQIQTLYDSFISILKTGVSHESDVSCQEK